MNKPARKVEVPGAESAPAVEAHSAPSTPPQAPDPSEDQAPVEAHSAPSTPPQAPDPSEDQARTDAALARVEATKDLVGSEKALDWSHLTTPNVILGKINHNPDDDLPSPDSIDWSKQPKNVNQVLTRAGWLLRP